MKKVLREEFNTKQVEIESLKKVKEELMVSVVLLYFYHYCKGKVH